MQVHAKKSVAQWRRWEEADQKPYGFNWTELSPLLIIILIIDDVFEIAER
jgi:hypothetical protein